VTITWEKTREKKEDRYVYPDPTVKNSDDDTLNDYEEYTNVTDPGNPDTDGDSIYDHDEEPGALTLIEGKDPDIRDVSVRMKVKERIPVLNIPSKWAIVVKGISEDNTGINYSRFKPFNGCPRVLSQVRIETLTL